MNKLRVRLAVHGDLGSVLGLTRRCVEAQRLKGGEDLAYPDLMAFEKAIEAGSLFVAEAERKILGCVARDESELVGERLVIDPAAQGTGLESKLLSALSR